MAIFTFPALVAAVVVAVGRPVVVNMTFYPVVAMAAVVAVAVAAGIAGERNSPAIFSWCQTYIYFFGGGGMGACEDGGLYEPFTAVDGSPT